jgi:hypothetical protein
MAEPHDSLFDFLGDLYDQVECFERDFARPVPDIVNNILHDLKNRLTAQSTVVSADAKRTWNKGGEHA